MIGWPNTWEQVDSVAQIAALVVGGYKMPSQFDWYVLPPISADILTLNRHVHEPLEEINYRAVKTFFIGALDAPREQEYWSHVAVFHCDAPASPQ